MRGNQFSNLSKILNHQNFRTLKSEGMWNFQRFDNAPICVFNRSQDEWPSLLSPGTEINQYSDIFTKILKRNAKFFIKTKYFDMKSWQKKWMVSSLPNRVQQRGNYPGVSAGVSCLFLCCLLVCSFAYCSTVCCCFCCCCLFFALKSGMVGNQ